MNHPKNCPRCGATLPRGGALEGLCPACMLRNDVEGPPELELSGGIRPRPEAPDLSVVQRDFPQLEILELIGRGGMGLVYKARQRRLDRLVALKVLHTELASDPAFSERFLREAQALAKLSHPNVVRVHDFGERQGRYFLLMEYVDGASLRDLLERGELPPSEGLRLVPQICAGLQYAHEQGIVHRDIKPENILIDDHGQVTIADFGLVKLLDKDEGDWRLTRASQIMGTPQYMAPEQMHRPREVDHRADIYSLGVVLYEMLTTELPTGRFALPSEKVRVDVRLDEVVLKALDREPERRFQRAQEMGSRVETISTGTQHGRPQGRLGEWPSPSSAAGGESWPAARRIPFKNEDKWGGFQVAHGLLSLAHERLMLEYRMHDCFEVTSSPVRTLEIPLAEISATEFKTGWFGGGQLILTGLGLDFSEDFTQFRPGSIRFKFNRSNSDQGRRLSEELRRIMERPRA